MGMLLESRVQNVACDSTIMSFLSWSSCTMRDERGNINLVTVVDCFHFPDCPNPNSYPQPPNRNRDKQSRDESGKCTLMLVSYSLGLYEPLVYAIF